MTQPPIPPGGRFTYELAVPDPGSDFFTPGARLQLDRGLYAVLLVEDPAEPGRYDHEAVVVLDDWTLGPAGAAPAPAGGQRRRRFRFRLALGGHRLTVTHTDGFPIVALTADVLLVGTGERCDALVTLGDGAFPPTRPSRYRSRPVSGCGWCSATSR